MAGQGLPQGQGRPKRELTAYEPTKARAQGALNDKWHEISQAIFTGRFRARKITVAGLVERWHTKSLEISRIHGSFKAQTLAEHK